jgi:hypothetical protein
VQHSPPALLSSASRLTAGAAGFLPMRYWKCRLLLAPTQYLFDSLHDWHLKILLVAAIIGHLAHIFFEGLQVNHSVVAFGIIVTAEPRSDKPRLTDFVMHELVTVDFRNIDCHLGLGKKSQFSQSDPSIGPIPSTAWKWCQYSGAKMVIGTPDVGGKR